MDHTKQPDINLDDGWGLSEAHFRRLTEQAKPLNPGSMVEFGSGGSTIRLHYAFPEAAIVSFEHEKPWLEHARGQRENVAANHISLHHAPLSWQRFLGGPYLTYSVPPDTLPEKVDLALIDGPPYATLRGREAGLYIIHSRLSTGGLVFLDDAQRRWEQQILANWRQTAGHCYDFELLEGDSKQMAMLRKTADAPLKSSPEVIRDARACRREIRRQRLREGLGAIKQMILQNR